MFEYSRREWLRKEDMSAIHTAIDADGLPELYITDGMSSIVSLLYLTSDPDGQQANMVVIDTLLSALTDLRSAYQDVIHPESMTR
jgi:hypothetical protein